MMASCGPATTALDSNPFPLSKSGVICGVRVGTVTLGRVIEGRGPLWCESSRIRHTDSSQRMGAVRDVNGQFPPPNWWTTAGLPHSSANRDQQAQTHNSGDGCIQDPSMQEQPAEQSNTNNIENLEVRKKPWNLIGLSLDMGESRM